MNQDHLYVYDASVRGARAKANSGAMHMQRHESKATKRKRQRQRLTSSQTGKGRGYPRAMCAPSEALLLVFRMLSEIWNLVPPLPASGKALPAVENPYRHWSMARWLFGIDICNAFCI